MIWREIVHTGKTEESGIAVGIAAAVIILAKIHVEMNLGGIGIFNSVGELGEQVFLCIQDIANARGKRVGEFSLLKDVQVWPEFKESGGIRSGNLRQAVFRDYDAETENIPLPANFQIEIYFIRERAGLVGNAGREGNIGLGETTEPKAGKENEQEDMTHGKVFGKNR